MKAPRFVPNNLNDIYQHYVALHSVIVEEHGAAKACGNVLESQRYAHYQEMLDDVLTHLEALLYTSKDNKKPVLTLIQCKPKEDNNNEQ